MNIRLIVILLTVISISIIVLFVGYINSGKLVNTLNLPCSTNYQADLPTLKLNKSSSELPQELVFFLKSNSTGHLCIRYVSKAPLNNTLSIVTIPYVKQIETYLVKNQPTTNITITASPSSIGSSNTSIDTVVMYTITAGNSNGIYRLPVSFICNTYIDVPIAVWSNTQEINSSDLRLWMGPEHGICKSPIDSAQIVGFDGGSLEYHEITPVSQ